MTTFIKTAAICAIGFGMAGCVSAPATAPVATAPTAPPNPKVIAECALMEEGMKRDAAATGQQNLQIVLDCPGFEHVTDTSNQFSGAGSFLSAASAKVPQAALDQGRMGKIIYQRMVLRGIPENIAMELVSSAAFKRAVASYNT